MKRYVACSGHEYGGSQKMTIREAIEQIEDLHISSHPIRDDVDYLKDSEALEKIKELCYEQGYEERPHGKWIKHSTYKDVLICSNCNHGSNQVYDTFNFCPNCGADMN